MTNWLNTNNGAVMAILTFVYVIATILICWFNYKSAKSVREQTRESVMQYIEHTRANVIPEIVVLEGDVICLAFKNIGKTIATDLIIDVSDEWLKDLADTFTCNGSSKRLQELKATPIFLTVDQSIMYDIWIPGNGHDDFSKLIRHDLSIDVSYHSTVTKHCEHFTIPLNGYNFLYNQSDYVRLTKKQISAIKDVSKELKGIKITMANKHS